MGSLKSVVWAFGIIVSCTVTPLTVLAEPGSRVFCESYLKDKLPITTNVASYLESLENPVQMRLALTDFYKWHGVEAALGRELSVAQKVAIVAVYDSAKGQLARNGQAAGEYYGEARYTKKQLQEKRALLEAAAFSTAEINSIFRTPKSLGPSSTQNDQIRFAVRKLKQRYNEGLKRLEAALLDNARLRRLPRWKGRGELPHIEVFYRIQALFGKHRARELYEHMQALELEVMVRTVEKQQSMEQSFQEVLERWETAHGFAPAIELEPRVYTGKEFRAMMRKGALPKDPGLRDPFHLGAGYDRLEFAQHGYDTHRVQWNIVMRDMRKNPQFYESLGHTPLASGLYKFMGDELLMKNLDWSGSGYPGYLTAPALKSAFPGSRTLWDAMFEGDGYQHDFHNPLFVRKLINDERLMIWPSLYNVFQ